MSCQLPADCAPPLVCGAPADCGGSLCYSCVTSTGSAKVGDPCAADADCASAICDPLHGVCAGPCQPGPGGDAQCGAGSALACTEESPTIGGVSSYLGYCLYSCLTDPDCPFGQICTVSTNPSADRLDTACGVPSPSRAPYGGSCVGANDCQSGVCITGTGGGCTTLCASAADCEGAFPQCVAQVLTLPTGTMQTLHICSP